MWSFVSSLGGKLYAQGGGQSVTPRGRGCHPKGRSEAEDGAAVDAPGVRRLSGLFWGVQGVLNSEGGALYLYIVATCS